MYYSGINPITNEDVFVERSLKKRNWMKENIVGSKDTRSEDST
jgi:hypothetical protein